MDFTKFPAAFEQLTGNSPFPWQTALYERFISDRSDNIPSSCDIPTGLGKTSVIAIWLLARDACPSLPRRLVYVVNRRTVVDQTTNEVERYKVYRPGLAVSTLRGQFADNRDWSADPSRVAVICGTVDMIGSRLLFSGYGVGFKAKPLHAGFIGQDSLIVHDEAHLEPAFQELLVTIQNEQRNGRFPDCRPLRVMELSATSRGKEPDTKNRTFTLTDEEISAPTLPPDPPVEPIHRVWRRLRSKKAIGFFPSKRAEIVSTMISRAKALLESNKAILIFARKVEDVLNVQSELRKLRVPDDHIAILTGTMRGLERDALTKTNPVFARFMNVEGIQSAKGTVFLICTSAGEVGVDMSGDHLICDLTTLESMMQRFGRVNRRGETESLIDVVYETDPEPKPKSPAYEATRLATLEILRNRLPISDWTDGRRDASPLGLKSLNLTDDEREHCFAPPPVTLETSDILFDAWSMTSIRDKMPGRPPVEPYLHGIQDYEPPETKVAWREEVGEITGDLLDEYPPKDLLDEYPLKPHELLGDRTDRVWKELVKLAQRYPLQPVWIVDEQGEVKVLAHLRELSDWDKKRAESQLGSKTVLLPHNVGGLTEQGMLNGDFPPSPKKGEIPPSINCDVADEWSDDKGPLRKRVRVKPGDADSDIPDGMKPVYRIVFIDSTDEEGEPIEEWLWFERTTQADADARGRSSYDLDRHLSDAEAAATRFVSGLSLDADLHNAVILAASCHDLGKDRHRWQRGIGNDDYPRLKWAKSGKRRGRIERSAYRHEFGSMLDIQNPETSPAFKALSDDSRELVLHLIAAHHGRARPHFTPEECLDENYRGEELTQRSIEAIRRFSRLQRKFGRWGLAYIESLVRAADYAASEIADKKDGGGAR